MSSTSTPKGTEKFRDELQKQYETQVSDKR